MKRGAAKQLTKDEPYDLGEEGSESDPGSGFRKADQTALAARPMKGLPRRVGTSSPAPPLPLTPSASVTPEPSASAPKFAGFSGFGVSTSATTPFSFAPAAKPVMPPSSSSGPGLVASTTSAFPTSASGPAVASNASPATKAFASFLTANTSASTELTPQVQNGPVPEDAKLKAETDYYRALRGLNVSLLNTITKSVDSDPFCDISATLERYKTLRHTAKIDFDERIKKASESPTPASSSPLTPAPIASAAFSFSKPPAEPTLTSAPTMPKPPTGFAGFGSFASTSATNSSAPSGGFVPSSAMPTALNFGPGATSASDSASLPVPSKSAFAPAPSPFGASSGNVFKFGTDSSKSASSNSAGSPFGSSSTPSVFASNLFGGDTSEEKDKGKEKEGEKKASPPSTPTRASGLFGSTPQAFSTPEKPGAPTSAFTFGAPSPGKSANLFGAASPGKSTSLFGGFGKTAAGSFGNPVGWQFASPPKDEEEGAAAPAASSSSKLPAFFSSVTPTPRSTDVSEGEASEAPSGEATPAPEDAPPVLDSKGSIHDLEGEGEEDETTAHEIRSKVFKLVKDDEGTPSWKNLGIGLLKVKVNKDNGARRLLLRNSSTGKVTVNFRLYRSMDPSVSKNTVSFIGHEEGVTVSYLLKVKTNDQADDLKKVLDREIDFVKSKSE